MGSPDSLRGVLTMPAPPAERNLDAKAAIHTEKQLDHSIDLEKAEASANRRLLDAQIAIATRAQWFTFVLVSVFLALVAYALHRGQSLATANAGFAALTIIACALWRQKALPVDGQSSSSDLDAADTSMDNDR